MTTKELHSKASISFAENKVRIIAYCGLMAAIIAVATGFIKIPTAIGYFHIGDGFIFLSAALLGPYGALAAAIGSVLADLMAGYIVYIPATFIIKGLMGLIAAYALKNGVSLKKCLISFIIAEILMMTSYFGFEYFLFGFEAALGAVAFNGIQGILGVAIGTFAVKLTAGKVKLFK